MKHADIKLMMFSSWVIFTFIGSTGCANGSGDTSHPLDQERLPLASMSASEQSGDARVDDSEESVMLKGGRSQGFARQGQREDSAQDEGIFEGGDEKNADDEGGLWNLRAPTLGGKQFWTDYVHLRGYRIQRHAWTGHYRLLNPNDIREAWGELSACQRKLNEIVEEKDIKPITGKVIIALHGLGRSRSSMAGMCRHLADNLGEPDEYTIINLSYASTRAEIADHAEALASVINGLDEVEEINFIAHSMGNIVTRHYLADSMAGGDGKADPRIRRMVMLAPPNQGSQMAETFRKNALFHAVWGRSGKQLSKSWEDLEPNLATPPFEFGVVAGGDGSAWNTNPLLSGDDDLIVTVEETKLDGARDFIVVRAAHTWLMDNTKVKDAAVSFLKNGYFVSAEERTPLPLVESRED